MKASEAITALALLAAGQTALLTQVDKVLVEEAGLQTQIKTLSDELNNTDADLPQALVDAINGVIAGGASVATEVQKLDDLVPDAPVVAPPATDPGTGDSTTTTQA